MLGRGIAHGTGRVSPPRRGVRSAGRFLPTGGNRANAIAARWKRPRTSLRYAETPGKASSKGMTSNGSTCRGSCASSRKRSMAPEDECLRSDQRGWRLGFALPHGTRSRGRVAVGGDRTDSLL